MSSPVSGQPIPPFPDPSVPCPLQSAVSHFHHFLTLLFHVLSSQRSAISTPSTPFCSMSSPVSGQPFPPLPDPSVPCPLQSAVSHFHHFLTLLFHVLSSQRSAISTPS
ncbi:hypothetical protein ACOMHN_062964 [Nucella lapillus]